jgi:hypothetical protein
MKSMPHNGIIIMDRCEAEIMRVNQMQDIAKDSHAISTAPLARGKQQTPSSGLATLQF